MKEKIIVRGSKYWVSDKECKILISHFDTKKEAKRALKELEMEDRANDRYVPYFYSIVEGVLGALRLSGYTALDDIHVCADVF